jgi:uncharacterized membrane protein YccC
MAVAIAIAFGLDLSYADWLPCAVFLAMKPSLDQSTVRAAQRMAGVLIGACAAALLMLIPNSADHANMISARHALEVVAIFLLMHAVASFFWNYAIYATFISATVLLSIDLPHPSSYSADLDRVLFTLIGLGIAVLVMFIGDQLGRVLARRASGQPHPA